MYVVSALWCFDKLTTLEGVCNRSWQVGIEKAAIDILNRRRRRRRRRGDPLKWEI